MEYPVQSRAFPIVFLIASVALCSGILYGDNLGIISGAVLFVAKAFSLSPELKEVMISAAVFGAMLGAIAGGKLADSIGRRQSILWGAGLAMAATVVGALSPNIWLLIAHRLLVGFSFGLLACVTPLYLAEISPKQTRGRLGALFSVALTIGLLLSYLTDLALSTVSSGWRWMFFLGMLQALPLIGLVLQLPESPRWLHSTGARDRARAGFERLLGQADATAEIDSLARTAPAPKARLEDLFKPVYRAALIAGIGLAVVRQGTGAAISTLYAPELLAMAGFASLTVELAGTVGVGVIYLTATLISLWLVDRIGRRPLMLAGLTGMILSLGVMWFVFRQPAISDAMAIVAVASLFVFAGAFAIGPGAVVFLLLAELMPQQIRGIGMGFASFVLWATFLTSTLTFPLIVATVGKSGTFAIYAGLGIAAWVFVYIFVPETKGRQLEDIGT